MKPTLLPFALVGITRERWWITFAMIAAVAVALEPLWAEYVAVLTNARGPRVNLTYSLGDVPLMLVALTTRIARPAEMAERAVVTRAFRGGWRSGGVSDDATA
jgi:hypothetical protein